MVKRIVNIASIQEILQKAAGVISHCNRMGGGEYLDESGRLSTFGGAHAHEQRQVTAKKNSRVG